MPKLHGRADDFVIDQPPRLLMDMDEAATKPKLVHIVIYTQCTSVSADLIFWRILWIVQEY
jgi:hypothetical protein